MTTMWAAEEEDAVHALVAATRAGLDESCGRVSAKAASKRASSKQIGRGSGSPAGGNCKSPKTRWRILPSGQKLLETVYAQTPLPTSETRDALAIQLGATPRQVQVWFQNKRQRSLAHTKREQYSAEGAPSSTPCCVREVDMTPQSQVFNFTYTSADSMSAPQLTETCSLSSASTAAQPATRAYKQPDMVRPAVAPKQTAPNPTPPDSPPPTHSHAVDMEYHPQSHVRRNDSLADLAEVAECVESIEQLAGGRNMSVGSLKDLAKDLANISGAGSPSDCLHGDLSLKGLVSLSRVSSLKDITALSLRTKWHRSHQ